MLLLQYRQYWQKGTQWERENGFTNIDGIVEGAFVFENKKETKNDFPNKVSTALEFGSIASGNSSFRFGTKNKPISPKVYTNGWGGNGSTKTMKIAPKLSGAANAINIGVDAIGVYDYYVNGDEQNGVSVTQFGVNRVKDIAVGALMKNPITGPITILYVGLETFYPGGFNGAMENSARLENANREILGDSFKIHGSCGKW
jgi:hypothetical protein